MSADPNPSRAGSLARVAGVLALDFVNTISGRGGPGAVEHLREPADLIAWARHAGLLASGAELQAPPHLLERGLALRERLARIAAAIAAGAPAPAADLTALAAAHGDHLAKADLVPEAGRYAWHWSAARDLAAAVLGPVTLSATTLLTDGDLRRLKRCPGEDCGWYFHDTSKSGRRRWCEMEVCGNRAKLRAWRRRRVAANAD